MKGIVNIAELHFMNKFQLDKLDYMSYLKLKGNFLIDKLHNK